MEFLNKVLKKKRIESHSIGEHIGCMIIHPPLPGLSQLTPSIFQNFAESL